MKFFRISVREMAVAITMIASISLSACTANTGSADERGLLPHLTVDLQLPQELTVHSAGQYRIEIKQGGKPVQAERVIFEFSPEGQSDQVVSVPGVSVGEGMYAAEYLPSKEGVYVVRCRVASGGLEAMPAKRFAIGEEAVLILATLEPYSSTEDSGASESSGHSHH